MNNIYDGFNFMNHTHSLTIPCGYPIPPSDICVNVPCPSASSIKDAWGSKANKKEKEMASYATANVVTADSIERDQREFAGSALRKQMEIHKLAMKRDFGMVDDEEPTTVADFIKRITDGQYTVDERWMDTKVYSASCAAGYIRWRDPKKVEDKAGYEAARKELDAAYESAKADAILGKIEDLRGVLKAFADWKLS